MTDNPQPTSCHGKMKFRTFKEAERSMRITIRKSGEGGGGMSVYECRYCQTFHFGHDRKKQPSSEKRNEL